MTAVYLHWFEDAERNRESALGMLKSKHYDWGLFVWQLSLEKLLKGIMDQDGKDVLLIHNLSKLAIKAGLQLSNEQFDKLDEISSYNIEARYDDYKYRFYKKATAEYSAKWSKVCDELYIWIKKHQKH